MASESEITAPTSVIAKKIAAYPAHFQVGLAAYRAALTKRQDWHQAVAAAIEAAEAAREKANA